MDTTELIFNEKIIHGAKMYDRLAKLQNSIIKAPTIDVKVEITKEAGTKYSKTAVFIIGSLIRLAKVYQKDLTIFPPPKMAKDLNDMGIYSFYGNWPKITLKAPRFVECKNLLDALELVNEIVEEIPVNLSVKFKSVLSAMIGEVFNNAREHAETDCVFGGRYFRGHGKYCFTCYDTGVGIVEKVRQHLKRLFNFEIRIPDDFAIKWAIESGNTTASSTIARGTGFEMLHSLAALNNGKIKICAGNILYEYDGSKGAKYHKLDNAFMGTLFEMEIVSDNQVYMLKGEENDGYQS